MYKAKGAKGEDSKICEAVFSAIVKFAGGKALYEQEADSYGHTIDFVVGKRDVDDYDKSSIYCDSAVGVELKVYYTDLCCGAGKNFWSFHYN